MSDFFDHLFDASSKARQSEFRLKERVKALIFEAPAIRRLPSAEARHIFTACPIKSADISLAKLPSLDLVLLTLSDSLGPDIFRHWKLLDQARPIWRMDPLDSETQVLETRAMGADAYVLNTEGADLAYLQLLIEVGKDYGLPAILRCQSAEGLALTSKLHDFYGVQLEGEVAKPALLDWAGIAGKVTILPYSPDDFEHRLSSLIHIYDSFEIHSHDKDESNDSEP